jgi:Na+/proline symporter
VKGVTPAEAAMFAKDPNNVFPVWITTVLPPGLTGLILAGAFAAAISSLDSVLAALTQTSLSAILGRKRVECAEGSTKMVAYSRIAVVVWTFILTGFAIWMARGHGGSENKNLIDLAFGMVAYTYGPLLGILLAAIVPGRRSFVGIILGTLLSMAVVTWMRPELLRALEAMSVPTEWVRAHQPKIAFPWFYPLTALLTFGFACLPLGRQTREPDVAHH